MNSQKNQYTQSMKTLTTICILSALAVLLSGQAARSQVQLSIVNASFENPVLSPGQYTPGVIGWSGPYLGTQNASGQGWFSSLPAGNNVAILEYDLTIAQTLTSNLSAGDYTLSAYVGQNLFINFPRTFALQLYAGQNLLAQTTALAPVGSLNLFTVNFGALASNPNLGQSLTVRFAASIEGPVYSTYNSTVLDGVSLAYTSWNPYWAPAVGGGGTGTWSGAGTNWAATAGVQGGGIQSPADLLFGDAAGTVTVSGGVNVAAGMTFSTDGYTVTNSTITLTGANAASNTITAAASIGTTISSQLAGANGMTKAGTGTVTLSGTNSYTGATIVNQGTLELAFSGDNNAGVGTIAVGSDITVNAGGTLLGSAVNALGSATGHTVDGTTDQLTINEGGQLRVGAGTVLSMPYALNVVGGTISSVDGGHPSFGTIFSGSTEGTFTSSSGGTAATISAQNFNLQGASFNVVQGGGPVDLSVTSNLIGNALTKNGNGVMVLSGNNTYSGATTVTGGVLNLNSSAGSSLGSTASVSVSTNATLLISQSGQVNNSAAVTLSGGTIRRGVGVSEVFGSLNITGSGILDFGTGAVGNLTFGTYQDNQQTESALLTLNNFMPGNSFTFSSTSFSTNSVGSYFTFGTGYAGSSIANSGINTFTITAIPEPSTILAALGLTGLMLWPARRRFTRQAEGSRNG